MQTTVCTSIVKLGQKRILTSRQRRCLLQIPRIGQFSTYRDGGAALPFASFVPTSSTNVQANRTAERHFHQTFLNPSTQTSAEYIVTLPSIDDEDLYLRSFEIPNVPDQLELKPDQRLIVLGDLNGDYRHLVRLLKLAGLIQQRNEDDTIDDNDCEQWEWCGDNTILCQVGNVVGTTSYQEVACWKLLSQLANEAIVQDGAVILLYGSQEVLHTRGVFQYETDSIQLLERDSTTTPEDENNTIQLHSKSKKLPTFERLLGSQLDQRYKGSYQWRRAYSLSKIDSRVATRWAAMEPGGYFSIPMRYRKLAVQVGNTILVHAGLTPPHLSGPFTQANGNQSNDNSIMENVSSNQSSSSCSSRFQGLSEWNQAIQEWITKPRLPIQVYALDSGINPDRMQELVEARMDMISNSMPSILWDGKQGGIETGPANSKLSGLTSTIEDDLNPHSKSPLWMSEYSSPSNQTPNHPKAHAWIEQILDELQVDRMIVGHRPQSRINAVYNGKLWRTHVQPPSNSNAMQQPLIQSSPPSSSPPHEILEICNDEVTIIQGERNDSNLDTSLERVKRIPGQARIIDEAYWDDF